MTEVWRDIEDTDGKYQISNLGRIKSFHRDKTNGYIMKAFADKKGYLFVVLRFNGRYKRYSVHRLVATAFIPNPDNLPQVNHKDEDKSNNRVDNLEWCTNHYNLCYGTHNQRVAIANRCHPAVSYGVFSIDGNGNFNFYGSIREASRQTGIPAPNIIRAIKSGTLRASGRYWRLSYEPPRHASPTTTERGDAEQSAMQQSALAR